MIIAAAAAVDAVGNSSTAAPQAATLFDSTPPVLAINVIATDDIINALEDNSDVVVSGTATGLEDGQQVSVNLNGQTYSTTATAGVWSVTIPSAHAQALPVVSTVSADASDVAGNAAATATRGVTHDTVPPTIPAVTTQVTNDTTPALSGTATVQAGDVLTVLVNGVTYTAGDGNLVDSGTGTWSLVVPAANALSEGVYAIVVTVTDLAGNSASDVTSNELTVDTTAPSVPTVAAQTGNDTTPLITGTANLVAGDSLAVSVNGVSYTVGDGNLADLGSGNWSLQIPPGDILAEGTYSVNASITDLAGNVSTDVTTDELVIDTTPPAIPTVLSLTTNDSTPGLSGTATVVAGDTLTVQVDSVLYTVGDGNLLDNGDGTWSLLIPTGNELTDGTYEVTATVIDAAGNSSTDASSNELVVDTVDPAVPTVSTLITNDTTPLLGGTATIGLTETLTVMVNAVTYTVGDGSLFDNGDGTWTLAVPSGDTLAEGVYSVAATLTDSAGNSASDVSVDELTIDITAPAVPSVAPQVTSNTTPTLTGTATIATAETLTVLVNSVTYAAGDGNLLDNGDGTWSLPIPAGDALSDGTYEVNATVTDAAGNSSTDASSDELVIDTLDPATPTVTTLTINDTTPTLSGTATVATGEILTVEINSVTYTAGDGNLVDNGDGTWSLTVPGGDVLPEGTFSVTATITDSASNSSSDVTVDELVIDITAPVVPTVATLTTNDTTPTFTGTATVAAGETLTVLVNSITYTAGDGNLVDNGDGTWSLTVPTVDALPEGTFDAIAAVTDNAGNSSSDATVDELVIDTTAPVVPTVATLTTNDTTPTVIGTATVATGETLTVQVNAITYTAGDGNLTDNGDGTWSLTIPASDVLPEGTFNAIATVTDSAGNSSSDATVDELVIDTTTPVAPTVVALTTNDTTPTVTGTATVATGETLTVQVNAITYAAGDGNLTDNGDGTWSLTIPAGDVLPEGTFDAIATAMDSAGNSSSDATVDELVIDTTTPVAPTVVALTTNDTTPTVTGTATVATGETLTVQVSAITYAAGDGNLTDNGDGTWSLTIPAGDVLPEGTFDAIAAVTDSAGNSSSDATVDELVIDTTAPVVPTVIAVTTNDTTPTVTGTATVATGETLTVQVNAIIYTAGDGNLTDNGDGTWSLTIPAGDALTDGTYEVTATVTDAAGNSSADASNNELVIDTVEPGRTNCDDVIDKQHHAHYHRVQPVVATGETLTVQVNCDFLYRWRWKPGGQRRRHLVADVFRQVIH